jgi:hypothetical protein
MLLLFQPANGEQLALRDELAKEIKEAMQRIPLVMEHAVSGSLEPTTDDLLERLWNVSKAQQDVNRVLLDAIDRLAAEIDRLR